MACSWSAPKHHASSRAREARAFRSLDALPASSSTSAVRYSANPPQLRSGHRLGCAQVRAARPGGPPGPARAAAARARAAGPRKTNNTARPGFRTQDGCRIHGRRGSHTPVGGHAALVGAPAGRQDQDAMAVLTTVLIGLAASLNRPPSPPAPSTDGGYAPPGTAAQRARTATRASSCRRSSSLPWCPWHPCRTGPWLPCPTWWLAVCWHQGRGGGGLVTDLFVPSATYRPSPEQTLCKPSSTTFATACTAQLHNLLSLSS